MNIANRTTHAVQQGTGAWLRLREGFPTASEAPAALGVSKYVTRSELLRRKHTGVQPEPDAATLGKFAAGHAAEAEARPLAEGIVGSDLFPTTMSATVDGLPLLASLDGQTLEGDVIWETKLWNEDLAAAVRANDLPAHYTVQMDQELLVSGAERCLFTCTDGTPERFVSCWYEADEGKFRELLAGWLQFNRDLAAYVVPQAAEPAPAGKAPDTLPALRIELTGQVTASNLAEFKSTALAAIRSVNRDLKTDADFADADKAVKWCADVEARLKAAKEHALSQTASIDELFKALDDIAAESKAVRLDLDKLVKRRKDEVREQAVTVAAAELARHVRALSAELAPMALRPVTADFAGSIKGLRSISSMQDALDTTLAGAKILADGQARGIRANVAAFKAATGDDRALQALFADVATLVHKPADDFRTLVAARIDTHRAAEARKEAERQAAEAARIAAAEQRARDEAAAAERQRLEADARAAEQARQDEQDREDARRRALDLERQAATVPAPIKMQIVPTSAPSQPEPATLNLGAICARLGFTVSAHFVGDVLGIQPAATDKRASLYTERQFGLICERIAAHVRTLAATHKQAAA